MTNSATFCHKEHVKDLPKEQIFLLSPFATSAFEDLASPTPLGGIAP